MANTDGKRPAVIKITPQFAGLISLLMAAEGEKQFSLGVGKDYLDACLMCEIEMLVLCFSDSGDGIEYCIWEGGKDVTTETKPLTSFDDAMADFQKAIEWERKDPELPCPGLVWEGYGDE
jgi:hypothetical protein